MRFFSHQPTERTARVPVDRYSTLKLTGPSEWGVLSGDHTEEIPVSCLQCPEEPCVRFSARELPALAVQSDFLVCPTDAITIDRNRARVVVGEACIGCGLCVLRCPYGAIRARTKNRPEDGPAQSSDYRMVLSSEFDEAMSRVSVEHERNPRLVKTYIEQAVGAIRTSQQASFYPLVGKLLSAAGFPTWVPRRGDTNNRIDAIIEHERHSIPIEIKSPTETLFINVKAVQQALENKILLRRRFRSEFPSELDTTSLVIGYEYPAERSDVFELVEDIKATYNIRIGLVDLRALYQLAIERYQTGRPPSLRKLALLEGKL